ncbi:MAG: type II toxin-antitoxin system YafQ family toxin [Paludibacteraceae bacterium]|nr:type II toxin-antitoxin system YafQ family toxin [Paludibacteraceae bacterium]
MYELVPSTKFKKDLKVCLKRGCRKEDIKTVLDYLIESGQVPSEYQPHKLGGEYNGLWECHIKPDWLLIYDRQKSIKLIGLVRTGRHQDLFDE